MVQLNLWSGTVQCSLSIRTPLETKLTVGLAGTGDPYLDGTRAHRQHQAIFIASFIPRDGV